MWQLCADSLAASCNSFTICYFELAECVTQSVNRLIPTSSPFSWEFWQDHQTAAFLSHFYFVHGILQVCEINNVCLRYSRNAFSSLFAPIHHGLWIIITNRLCKNPPIRNPVGLLPTKQITTQVVYPPFFNTHFPSFPLVIHPPGANGSVCGMRPIWWASSIHTCTRIGCTFLSDDSIPQYTHRNPTNRYLLLLSKSVWASFPPYQTSPI